MINGGDVARFVSDSGALLGLEFGARVDFDLLPGETEVDRYDQRIVHRTWDDEGATIKVTAASLDGRVYSIAVHIQEDAELDHGSLQRARAQVLVGALGKGRGAPRTSKRKKLSTWSWSMDGEQEVQLSLRDVSTPGGDYIDLVVTAHAHPSLDDFLVRSEVAPVAPAAKGQRPIPEVAKRYVQLGGSGILVEARSAMSSLSVAEALDGVLGEIDIEAFANSAGFVGAMDVLSEYEWEMGGNYGPHPKTVLSVSWGVLRSIAYWAKRQGKPIERAIRLAVDWLEHGDEAALPELHAIVAEVKPVAYRYTVNVPPAIGERLVRLLSLDERDDMNLLRWVVGLSSPKCVIGPVCESIAAKHRIDGLPPRGWERREMMMLQVLYVAWALSRSLFFELAPLVFAEPSFNLDFAPPPQGKKNEAGRFRLLYETRHVCNISSVFPS